MKQRVAVIGAGMGGLSAAIRLQAKGFQVDIFEKNDMPGGVMSRIEDRGYQFDVGPTLVMMPHLYREVFEAVGRRAEDYIQLEKLDPLYSVRFEDGEQLALSSDIAKLMPWLEAQGEGEAKGFWKYIDETHRRYRIAHDAFINRSYRHWTQFVNPKHLLDLLKIGVVEKAYDYICGFVKTRKLRQLLTYQTLYIGFPPKLAPAIYSMIPLVELLYGIWYIRGGMHAMARALEKLFGELGGTIHYHTPVSEILIENRRAVGVKIDHVEQRFDFVVCNAPFPYAVKNLLKDDSSRGSYTARKQENFKYSCSCFLLYLGVKRKLPTLDVHNVIFAGDYHRNMQDIYEGREAKEPFFYLYCPSRLDVSMAPDYGESLYALVPVPNLKTRGGEWREQEIAAYRDSIIKQIEQQPGLAGLSADIEVEHCYTPNTFAKKFNLPFGAVFGLSPTYFQSDYFRPRNKYPHLDGLYFAGSSTHPGAGVPIVLTSGRHAAEELLKDVA